MRHRKLSACRAPLCGAVRHRALKPKDRRGRGAERGKA